MALCKNNVRIPHTDVAVNAEMHEREVAAEEALAVVRDTYDAQTMDKIKVGADRDTNQSIGKRRDVRRCWLKRDHLCKEGVIQKKWMEQDDSLE